MARSLVLLFVVSTLPVSAGCVTTRPWQRSHLASPAMESPFGRARMEQQYRNKLAESRSGGSLPGEAPGGGCACTQ